MKVKIGGIGRVTHAQSPHIPPTCVTSNLIEFMSNMNIKRDSNTLTVNERIFWSVSYVLVGLMMGTVGITLTELGHRLVPTWQPLYLPVVCVIVSLERLYTYHYVKGLTIFSKPWLIFQLTQWVVMAIVLKLLVVASHGIDFLFGDILLWGEDFISNFFNGEYLIVLAIVFSVWWVSGIWADYLNEMRYQESAVSQKPFYEMHPNRPKPRQRLISGIFTLGMVMIILTVLMRLDLRGILGDQLGNPVNQLPYLAAGGGFVLFYFFLGFTLIAQSKFAVMYGVWSASSVSVDEDVAWKWAIYSLIFLFSLTFIVSFLPTGYSFKILPAIGNFLGLILEILVYIFSYVVFIAILLFSLLTMLFGKPAEDISPPSFPNLAQEPIRDVGVPIPWFDFLKTLLFWVVFLGVIVYSFSQYLRQHKDIVSWLKKAPGWMIIHRFWKWLKDQFVVLNKRVIIVLDKGAQRLRTSSPFGGVDKLRRYLSLRKLTPKQRIYFFFLAMLRRGSEGGHPRRNSQTPYEYAASLENFYPDVDKDITSLTEIFVEARYSQHDIDDGDANLVKDYWRRIRKAFRKRRNSPKK